MTLQKGELIGLIGPNGAGKTTFFNLLTGVYEPSEGTVELASDNQSMEVINGKSPDYINGQGIARTFQNIRLFSDLSVLENVMIAMHREKGPSMIHAFLRTSTHYETERQMRHDAMKLLEIFRLAEQAAETAKNLSYGQQRRLEIVRALATQPKILFLDEPAAGMNPAETAELTQLISQIREQFDLTIVLIEHDMSLVMDICERIYVLEYGRLIAQGTPEEIQNNEQVIQAYLGGND
ncbi:ABC transporter ATP-binding protein [Aerococcaceae bacterium DSM 111020]|nr:ABC transporter ATP-binding protein [Aerococcaceae bacterium DSM 111020]